MNKYLIIFLLLAAPCFARGLEGVLVNAELSESQKVELKAELKGFIHSDITPIRNDYVDDSDRGTVEYNAEKGNMFNVDELKVRNYSFHKIVIPDGTTIEGVNFSQENPHTTAITGESLTFIKCNLNNVEIDPSWTVVGGLQIHSRKRTVIEDDKEYELHEVEKEGVFNEISREEIISTP